MVELARRRLCDDVPLHVGDLAEPLPFADDSFDDVVASLVLHYLEDWSAPLAELREYVETLELDGQPTEVTFRHRPLRAMTRAFIDAGFTISLVEEPEPAPDTPPELLPPRIVSGERSAFLCFLFFVLEAPAL